MKPYKLVEIDNTIKDLPHARASLFQAKSRINSFKSKLYHKKVKIKLSELDKAESDIDKALAALGVKPHKEVI
ncbi:hypothetical protein M2S00_06800 [Apilactobacillus sp. TMW 2.2459]|uniref:hypothetical protein n=1 Tax=Apilactobacillus xinyiensis TaxID=2841032 RepID=UPI00200E963E|nr:hypothetical protein [Apilactobacillus xinyiensis]MCL0312813.1 hypothetical protein [Apilactobacillus xinyiensis]